MDVQLLVHLEQAEDGLVWWGESPELPGFSAVADSLAELQARARFAVEDILFDEGQELGSFQVWLVDADVLNDSPASRSDEQPATSGALEESTRVTRQGPIPSAA